MVYQVAIEVVLCGLRALWLWCDVERGAQGRWRHLPLILALLLPVTARGGTAEGYYDKASAQALAGDWAGALTNASRSIALQPNMVAPWLLRAEACQNVGNLPEAITNYSQAIALRPFAMAYFYRGMLEQQLDPHSPAVLADYNAAIRLHESLRQQPVDPSSPMLSPKEYAAAFYNRGAWKLSNGDREGAMEDLARAKHPASFVLPEIKWFESYQLNPAIVPPTNTETEGGLGNPFGLLERPTYVVEELKWYQFMTWHKCQLMAVIVIIGGYALRAVRRRREDTSSRASGVGK